MTDQVTVKGADRVASTLRAAGRDIGNMAEVNARVADVIASAARTRAPRDTGHLAETTGPSATKDTAGVGSPLVYAPVIHNGWPAHHIAPNPYITDAATDTEDEWMDLYNERVVEVCGEVKGA